MKQEIEAQKLAEEEGKPKKGKEKETEEQPEEKDEPWLVKYNPKTCEPRTRWNIPAHRTIRLFIKYYNTATTGHYP